MSERAELLRAVVENPDDDAPRLAFADWLDAHADDFPESEREADRARAAYVRHMVEHARIPMATKLADPWAGSGFFGSGTSTWADLRVPAPYADGKAAAQRERLWDTAFALERQYAAHWAAADLPPMNTDWKPSFRRGFIEHLQISPRFLSQDPDKYFNAAPLRKLTLEWDRGYGYNRLEQAVAVAALPHLARIREIDFLAAGAEFVAAFVRAFVVSPHATGLHSLNVSQSWNDPTAPEFDAALQAIAGSDYLADLRSLDLSGNVPGAEALEALGSSTKLPGLRRLTLHGCGLNAERTAALFRGGLLHRLDGIALDSNATLDADAARELVSAPGFSRFRALSLGNTSIGNAGCLAIATSNQVGALESITLSRNGIGGEGVAELLTSDRLTALTTLLLDNNDIKAGDVAQFAAVTPTISLARLTLNGCPLGDDGLRILATSPLVPRLTHLRLRGCDIGDEGVAALASANLTRLQQLDLGSNRITDVGAVALARSPHLEGLEQLDVGYNAITGEGALALAELPGLRPYRFHFNSEGVSKGAEKKIEKLLGTRKPRG